MDFQTALAAVGEIAAQERAETYWVGGSLRDLFLDRPTQDLDFALADPKPLAERVARRLGADLFTLKEEWDIHRVACGAVQLDLARFKGPDIAADLMKRDFTVNALAAPLSAVRPQDADWRSRLESALLDPSGGKADLARRRIRQVAPAVFDDDPLRMLRAFRIAAQLGFEIGPETLENIRRGKDRIRRPAAERVREELLLTLDCPRAYPAVLAIDAAGLLSALFPEIDPNRACAIDYYPGKGVWGHSLDGLDCLEWIFENLKAEFPEDHESIARAIFAKPPEFGTHPPSTLMKLGILFHDLGKAPTAQTIGGRLRFFQHEEVGARIAQEIGRRLKLSSDQSHGVATLVREHMRPGGLAHVPGLTEKAQFRFFRNLGSHAVPMLLVSLADRYTYLTPQERGRKADLHERVTKEMVHWHYVKEMQKLPQRAKLLDGHALMSELGLKPGPRIGQILKDLEEAAVLGEIHTREEALAFAKKRLESREPNT